MSAHVQPQQGSIIDEDDLFKDPASYTSFLDSLDAILLLGGGVPLSPNEPPVYVQRRCDVVAQLLNMVKESVNQHMHDVVMKLPSVVCLSAGTAHLPQFITLDGLP
jgi:hypothetical protein